MCAPTCSAATGINRSNSTAGFITARMRPMHVAPRRRSKEVPDDLPRAVTTALGNDLSRQVTTTLGNDLPRAVTTDIPRTVTTTLGDDLPCAPSSAPGTAQGDLDLLISFDSAVPKTVSTPEQSTAPKAREVRSGSETTAHDRGDARARVTFSEESEPSSSPAPVRHSPGAAKPEEERVRSPEPQSPSSGAQISLVVHKEASEGSVRAVLSSRQNATGLRQDELLEVPPLPVAQTTHSPDSSLSVVSAICFLRHGFCSFPLKPAVSVRAKISVLFSLGGT